ncbi:trypsin-like peptidase domain-containing protein [Streptomyces sp. NPDC059009]|uniref:VMAP-C domain-containing protein n=1 Tax=Streptomyces sp. NPDC059009 TaxID=3346694 RepID=UPI0036781A5B
MSPLHALVRRSIARIEAPRDGYAPHGDHHRGSYWGSGFFIAPGWLLTCAHVVGKGGGRVWRNEHAVGVTWEGGTTTGKVVLAKPRPEQRSSDRSSWDFPDLALVEVPAATDASCVWLSERPLAIPGPISSYGWSTETGELALRHGIGESHALDGDALLFGGSLPVDGASGGPVVDLANGAVIGLNKGRGRGEGAAVPISALRELYGLPGGHVLHEVIREHDRHHRERLLNPLVKACWPRIQAWLSPPGAAGLAPALRAHLYDGLSQLPPPRGPMDVLDLVDEVKSRMLRDDYFPLLDEEQPHTWREGAGRLHGLPDLRDATTGPAHDLDAVLLYAAKVVSRLDRTRREEADPAALRELARLVMGQAESAHQVIREEIVEIVRPLLVGGGERADAPAAASAQPQDPTTRVDVRIEIGDEVYGRYPWRVLLLRDGQVERSVRDDDRGVPRARLEAALREWLAYALSHGDRGEHLAAVEALLPPELFDLPIDMWRLRAADPDGADGSDGAADPFDEHSLPLGLRRTVVIRARRRSELPASPERRRLWAAAERGPLTAVPMRREVVAHGHAPGVRKESRLAAYDRLSDPERDGADGCVPVYCGPVGGGDGCVAMSATLAAGHPLALWRRDGRDHEDCQEFRVKAGELLEKAGRADGLHRHIRRLRIQNADPDAEPETRASSGWARNIAVLLDPADHEPYGGGQMTPPPIAGT